MNVAADQAVHSTSPSARVLIANQHRSHSLAPFSPVSHRESVDGDRKLIRFDTRPMDEAARASNDSLEIEPQESHPEPSDNPQL